MKVRTYSVLEMAVDQGVRCGVRRAFKHSDQEPPTESQMDTIANELMTSICEWFTFDDEYAE